MQNSADPKNTCQGAPDLSVVVPVYNEQDNLIPLTDEILSALVPLGRGFEILYVDDGSSDASLKTMRELAGKHPQVRFVAFAANRGQSAAFRAGFAEARGRWIITMDADRQNDPADVPAMLQLVEQGNDMVIGWRAKRQDSFAKKYGSRIANAVRNRLTRETVQDTGCSLKIMDAAMAKQLPMFTGMHRFLPTLMKMQGARVAEVKVNHRPRVAGVSKYGTWDRLKQTVHDVMAVRWMQSRWSNYEIKERGE